ncbi:MAG: enoyl-CoA hydratase/isomerase family protein [Cyanobacteria bacterium P01_F01_bin.53]
MSSLIEKQAAIAVTKDGPVALITLNTPEKHNALSTTMLRDLRDELTSAQADESIHVLVLRAAGERFFCAGIDLSSGMMSRGEDVRSSILEDFVPLVECIQSCSKPIIASVQGGAIGLGCALAMHCDFLVLSEDATFDFVFSSLGLVADGGTNWLLMRKLGYSVALELILEAQKLDAQRCLSLGIANKVVPRAKLDSKVASWAQSLATRATLPQGYAKKLMRAALAGSSLVDVVAMEAEAQAVCIDSEHFQNAYARFLQK